MDKNDGHSLCVFHHEEMIFSHNGKWLHPLFELELFLSGRPIDPRELSVRDKIVGKAAAMLMVRMGIRRVHARTLSEPGLEVYRSFGVEVSYDLLVPRIQCQTETILENIDDPEEASIFLLRRGKRDVDAALIVESLTVRRGDRTVLANLSFAVTRGEKVIIQGDNGAGKSTFLKAVLGTAAKDAGAVIVAGRQMRQLPPELLGYLGQHTKEGDIPVTAGEFLRLGALRWKADRTEAQKRISEAVAFAGIGAFLDRPMNTLSGGERRRTDLARCFIQEPAVLLLDEPTAGLDKASRESVMKLLNAYAALHRSAIVMVTHESGALDLPGWRYHELKGKRLVPLSRPVTETVLEAVNGNI